MQNNYQLVEKQDVTMILEKDPDFYELPMQMIDAGVGRTHSKRLRKIYRRLKHGSGFQGRTPSFMLPTKHRTF